MSAVLEVRLRLSPEAAKALADCVEVGSEGFEGPEAVLLEIGTAIQTLRCSVELGGRTR
jgi:hypothetical protein